MKQIKTIKNRLDNNVVFDKEVNDAIAEGWTLTKRKVLQPYSQAENFHNFTFLYAELERETAEPKRCCEACGMERCTNEPCVKGDGDALKEEPQNATI